MTERRGGSPLWEGIRRYYILPATLLWLGVLGVFLVVKKVEDDSHRAGGLRGGWEWSDSTLFEFQKVSLRFTADSFFMTQRFMDPRNPGQRLPCAHGDYEAHVAGTYALEGDSLIRFSGDFTDHRYSRDTLRLCRDTGFRTRSAAGFEEGHLCLRGGPFARKVCFARREYGSE